MLCGQDLCPEGEKLHQFLGEILASSRRAKDLVSQILTFSRRSTPTREFVNLSRLVLDLQPLLRRRPTPRHR